MKELVVISGKGGTGKTSLTAAFASLAKNMVLCDADVDAADLHLLMAPEIIERHEFQGGHEAVINKEKCTRCGLCRDLCNWSAIDEEFKIAPLDCEGCGVCVYFCPEKAIDFPIKTCGEWFISDTRFGPMVHARLGIAEENSGRLVTVVRQQAAKLAEARELDLILTDGPPGIGCPVIASITAANAVLIVVEPTLSGKHDMMRVAELAENFRVSALICVNKFDLNEKESKAIEGIARERSMEVLPGIPFDPVFTKAMIQGQTLLEYDPRCEASQRVRQIWKRVAERLE